MFEQNICKIFWNILLQNAEVYSLEQKFIEEGFDTVMSNSFCFISFI